MSVWSITPEHPVMTGPGEYRIARLLKAGDRIYRMSRGELNAVPIRSIREVPARLPAYNLLVMPGGTFMPADIVVHNKGCFLPESLIMQADGSEKPISAVRPGDPLLAYSPEGRIVRTRVREILRHRVDEYFILTTERQTIKATAEHPFYVGHGAFKTLEILKAGDAHLRPGRRKPVRTAHPVAAEGSGAGPRLQPSDRSPEHLLCRRRRGAQQGRRRRLFPRRNDDPDTRGWDSH